MHDVLVGGELLKKLFGIPIDLNGLLIEKRKLKHVK